ncbi:hypothetical protein SAMD00019534_092230, partial [Acytostelium subglobosum LB1]|uniref:hypothetical protein n=1 Tax=Acytostelium subglobosum LB1 TaxID=1410327 RepID=UPI000644EBF7
MLTRKLLSNTLRAALQLQTKSSSSMTRCYSTSFSRSTLFNNTAQYIRIASLNNIQYNNGSSMRLYSSSHTKAPKDEEDDKEVTKKTSTKETETETVVEIEEESLDDDKELEQKKLKIKQELERRVQEAHNKRQAAAAAATATTTSGETQQEQQKQQAGEQDKASGQEQQDGQQRAVDQAVVYDHVEQTRMIYRIFGFSVTALIGLTLYKVYEDGISFLKPQFDPMRIITDAYQDHHTLFETGSDEFNAMCPPNTVMSDSRLITFRIPSEDIMTLVIPIIQKSSRSLVATGNIDLLKEGNVFRVSNLYIDVVNGLHFNIDIPNIKYDITSEKY